jgi:hypothetical protein
MYGLEVLDGKGLAVVEGARWAAVGPRHRCCHEGAVSERSSGESCSERLYGSSRIIGKITNDVGSGFKSERCVSRGAFDIGEVLGDD